jgi:hypothetical protein
LPWPAAAASATPEPAPGGSARTTSGTDAANADVKASTSAPGATPANNGERR